MSLCPWCRPSRQIPSSNITAGGRPLITTAFILHHYRPPVVASTSAQVEPPCLTTPAAPRLPLASRRRIHTTLPAGRPQHELRHPHTSISGQQHSERIIVELCRHHALLALGAHAQALNVDAQVKLLIGRNERALVVNKDSWGRKEQRRAR